MGDLFTKQTHKQKNTESDRIVKGSRGALWLVNTAAASFPGLHCVRLRGQDEGVLLQ